MHSTAGSRYFEWEYSFNLPVKLGNHGLCFVQIVEPYLFQWMFDCVLHGFAKPLFFVLPVLITAEVAVADLKTGTQIGVFFNLFVNGCNGLADMFHKGV